LLRFVWFEDKTGVRPRVTGGIMARGGGPHISRRTM